MQNTIEKIRTAVKVGQLGFVKHDDDVIELETQYPKLYEMVTSSHCDETMLKNMLALYTKVSSGQITRQKGDEMFGERAAKQYVYPLVEPDK